MSRVRFNTNDSTYVDDTSYDIDSNVQLDHEILERRYGNINPNLDENSEAKALADRKKGIPVNDVDINVNESVRASNMVQGTLDLSNSVVH
ncbi:hypothetical protein H5410_005438 [Solanum commersonii]|uniref:Uncharacterized protein n=1 Tax=Solanum commersonii TaxID=4109 RepID=A0A9J6A7K1_SOLCO|nr:hypothetical protein H5410_005438 [Solanum commersonii]